MRPQPPERAVFYIDTPSADTMATFQKIIIILKGAPPADTVAGQPFADGNNHLWISSIAQ